MMDKDGGPAFPMHHEKTADYAAFTDTGMSMRDYFAAAALPAIIMVCAQDNRPAEMERGEYFAVTAYRTADAMLKAGGHTDDQ